MDEVMMKCPEGGSGCSFEGVEYEADADGLVLVPNEAVSVLMEHGFTVAAQDVPAGKSKKGGK